MKKNVQNSDVKLDMYTGTGNRILPEMTSPEVHSTLHKRTLINYNLNRFTILMLGASRDT